MHALEEEKNRIHRFNVSRIRAVQNSEESLP